MARFEFPAVDMLARDPATDTLTISVCLSGVATLASLFSDAALSVARANPVVLVASTSNIPAVHVAAGTYDLRVGGVVVAAGIATVAEPAATELPSIQGAKVTFSGTGAQTAFPIPHGLGATPTRVAVTPASVVAGALFSVVADATNLTVTFAVAPASGTNNVALQWLAGL